MTEIQPTITSNIEYRKTSEFYRNKKNKLIAAGSLTLALLSSGCSSANFNYGEPNPNDTSMTLDQDGLIRTEPVVSQQGEDNIIYKIDLGGIANQVTIDTPGGVYESSNGDGKWFGIPAKDLPKKFTAEHQDTDGIYWVNEIKAKVGLIPNKTSVNPAPTLAK